MGHYKVEIISDFNTIEYESPSRNSIKHLRMHGGKRCIVRDRNGSFVSGAEYTEGFGYYHINSDEV